LKAIEIVHIKSENMSPLADSWTIAEFGNQLSEAFHAKQAGRALL